MDISIGTAVLWIGYIHKMQDEWRQRLKARMDELGLSPAEVTRRAGVGPTMIHDILKRGASPSIKNLHKISIALGVKLTDILSDNDLPASRLSILGVTTHQREWVVQNLEVGKFVDFETLYGDNEFIVVEGQEFLPDYRPGDLIGGPRTLGGNIDNLIGLSECIVETKAGDRLIRYVHRGSRPGRFTLRSSRPATPDITDVQISWAIPIRIILRR